MTSVLVWTSETTVIAPLNASTSEEPDIYVTCRIWHCEKPLGQPCGLPCV